MKQKAMFHEVPRYTCRLVREAEPLMVRERSCSSFDDAARLFEGLRELPHEEVHVAYLNNINEVIGYEVVSRGGAHGSVVSVADLFRGAILANARSFLMAHNHPSGDLKPSIDDVRTTESVKKACELLGLTMVDHVIITRTGAVSVLDGVARRVT